MHESILQEISSNLLILNNSTYSLEHVYNISIILIVKT
jgi:hypothetical protein